ncbi:DUF4145 domain-containing protein [Collimonas sp.]|jgi:hypothetical protein|uniref:DUF4145 domain-containing protein n=1 Tax=Collimonas sp. TaxID=1963772 RepID=UPI0039C85B0C
MAGLVSIFAQISPTLCVPVIALGINLCAIASNTLLRQILANGANCTRLAVLGIRALPEHIMVEKIGDQGSFEENLAAFHAAGSISSVQRSAMSPAIQAGHASMHRAYTTLGRCHALS